jgi:hypothetical protein
LQREANRIFGYTAKQTLDLAQALYEKRLLTYPRTDSSFLTDDMGGTAADIITLLCDKLPFMEGAGFTPGIAKVLDSKKVSDHHAIIPTMELAKADPDALPESERNILTLAGRVCSLPPPSRTSMKRLRRFSHAPGQTSPQRERPYLRRVGKRLNADTGRR